MSHSLRALAPRLQAGAPGLGMFILLTLATSVASALVGPPADALHERTFIHGDLLISNLYLPVEDLTPALAAVLLEDLAVLGIAPDLAFFDLRTGRWGTLVPGRPVIPGTGRGNDLSWEALGLAPPSGEAELATATWSALSAFLTQYELELGIALAELAPPTITTHEDGALVQIHAGRLVQGLPVRDSSLQAVINHGNLVLLGARNWAAVAVSTQPAVGAAAAEQTLQSHLGAPAIDGWRGAPSLAIVPSEVGLDERLVPPGLGLTYRLAWVLTPQFAGSRGTWEALVDAASGDLLAFRDLNQYASARGVSGGVYPLSNDGFGPEGTEQDGYPMSFADLVGPAGEFAADTGGDLACVSGQLTTTLAGPFVKMNDNCGAIAESSGAGDIDLESSGGTDCVVPGGHSAGDTHASRSGFYEVNKQKELARGQLPGNPWLKGQLTANMNIEDTCNAFWNGATINFYQSGGGCANSGEIGAVFDHEWGHGMDDNDANPGSSSPGESIADIYGTLRLPDPCFGRGFLPGSTDCNGGYGDPCVASERAPNGCSGVRGVDWDTHLGRRPHDIDWILSNTLDVPADGIEGGCVGVPSANAQFGPCQQETHCEGYVAAEAGWDLAHRDLQGLDGSPHALDRDSALQIAQRLTYLGGGTIGNWYQCRVPDPSIPALGSGDGCNADGGYLNYLAADDDNGDLADGTPHMTAIYGAFARHDIACPAPAPQDSGCADGPAAAPILAATATNKGALLSWNAVPGAVKYQVVRSEGVLGCFLGKAVLGETTDTVFLDSGLRNGFPYQYGVIAVGASHSCTSPMSDCAAAEVVPQATPGFEILADSTALEFLDGDGDGAIDNCETVQVRFAVRNNSDAAATNVRIASAELLGEPDAEVTIPAPAVAASLAPCAEAEGSVEILAGGFTPQELIRLRVEVTSDELAPGSLAQEFRFIQTELDYADAASQTFAFDFDLGGWQMVSGNYAFLPGSGSPSPVAYLGSTGVTDQCDEVRSPVIRLTADTTLSLWNQFNTEPANSGINDPTMEPIFYDRGNVGIFDLLSGERATVTPDGGRPYNAGGGGGICVTAAQPGWATVVEGDTGSQWLQSSFSSAALAEHAGELVQVDLAYGVDQLVTGAGFHWDHVTLTDFQIPTGDTQDDVCQGPGVCGEVDDADPLVEYHAGWHRRNDARASHGGYHRRMGNGNGAQPFARVVFDGDSVTYFYVKSNIGGTADILIDGQLRETLSYGPGGQGQENPTFGHSRTYAGLGGGSHELRIQHRSGAVYVDGFDFPCAAGEGADPSAAAAHSVTQTTTASSSEGPVITRQIAVDALTQHVSVVVEGSLVPLTVSLLDPAGLLLASSGALIPGLTVSGVDVAVGQPGTYTIRIPNPLGAFTQIGISTARTVTVP